MSPENRYEKSEVRNRTVDLCFRAAKLAGAIDCRRVAFGILKAVSHSHTPEAAIIKLQHWQPALFRSTKNNPAPIPPPIQVPDGWRPSLDACKQKTEAARAYLAGREERQADGY